MKTSNEIHLNMIHDELFKKANQNIVLNDNNMLKATEISESIQRSKFYIKHKLPYIRKGYTLLEWVSTNNFMLYLGMWPWKEIGDKILEHDLVFYNQNDNSFYKMPVNQYLTDYSFECIKIHTLLIDDFIKVKYNKYIEYKQYASFI